MTQVFLVATEAKNQYSTSMKELATVCCFLEYKEINCLRGRGGMPQNGSTTFTIVFLISIRVGN